MKQKTEQMTRTSGSEMDEGPESNNPREAADPGDPPLRHQASHEALQTNSAKLKGGVGAQARSNPAGSLQQIKPQGQPTEDLAKSMSAGNFAQTQAGARETPETGGGGQLKGEQLNQAAEWLQKMAEEINKAAANKQDLQKKLEQAGLDKSLADNPQAAKQAMEKSNLSEQQKQDLQKQAEASSRPAKRLADGESLSQMASQCQNAAGGRQGDKQSNKSQQGQQSSGQQGQKMDGTVDERSAQPDGAVAAGRWR